MSRPLPSLTSLTARFIALMAAVTILGITLVATLSLYEHAIDARGEAEHAAVDRALTVLDAMETAATGESLSRFIFSTAAQPAIRAIVLLDNEGDVLLASRHAWLGRQGDELRASGIAEWLDTPATQQLQAHWDEARNQVLVVAPLDPINPASATVRNLEGGRLVLTLDARPYLAGARNEAWFDAAWAGSILLAVMALLTWVLHRRVGRPLQALHLEAAHPGRVGTQDPRAIEGAPRELKTLATAVQELARTRLALEQEKRRVSDIADTIPGAVYEYRHHRDGDDEFTFVSAGILSLLDLAESAVEGPLHERMNKMFWSKILPEDQPIIEQATRAANQPVAGEWQAEFRIRTSDGIRWLWGHALPVDDAAPGQLFRGVILDITPRKALERQLEQAASHDPLTGALNRAGIEPQLEASLAGAQRQDHPLAVAMLDIDHFKKVNDNHGHAIGDAVLKELVAHLGARLRKSDSLARWGGEEFLILLPHTDREGAVRLAEELRREIATAQFVHREPLSISLGVATSREGDSVESLLRRADHRLYQAKAMGRDRVVARGQEASATS